MPERLEIVISGKDEFSKTFGKLKSALPSIKTLAIGAGAAVAGLGTALFAMAKSTAEAYDRVQKFSDQLGLTTEFISKMQHAAELSGVQNLNKGLQMLQVRIGEAARGIGQGKDALEALGVSLYDVNGQLKTAEGILPDLAEGFYRMTNATERAEAASKIFGQRGIEMVQLFKDGRAGLEAMTAEAEKFGLVVSAQAGANAAAFNDALTRVAGSLRGLRNAIAEQILPIITGLANRLADFVANNRDEIIAFGIKFIDVMAKILEYTAYAIAGVIDYWRGLKIYWNSIAVAFAEFARILMEGLDWILQKHLTVMEALNFRGIFDEAIAKVGAFQTRMGEAINFYENVASSAQERITALIDEGWAVGKVHAFTQAVREAIAEIQEEGTATVGGREPTGIPPFTPANLEKSKEIIEAWRYHQAEVLEEFYGTEEEVNERFVKNLEDTNERTAEAQSAMLQQGYNLATAFGKKAFALQKGIAIAQATIKAYEAFNTNLAAFPFPLGPIMAALALATGLAQVAIIARTKYGGEAHGGLTSVPREQTYLLNKGERVVSAAQNADLMEFIGRGGASRIDNVNIHVEVAPNATNANALMDMDERVFEEIVEEKIIPALSRLSASGITYD